ncbi:hypothetical protein [Actinomadura litoris]|uniref:Uncharacterized protein n=1 Tax=Actinomadura litoris TaxID=2678616 RepID=A0A7K1L6W2_9ACTN|nr:hypothetical protein [Actinomadura litoris]MUN40148.1 hypothetical protein [Actinomadura litoris]
MTPDPHDEHGEILRRALNAEADAVSPAGDGLERIRARIADGGGRRRFGLERFGGAWLGPNRFAVNWTRPVLAVAAAVAVAGIGVTAPQTIDLIQHSVGSDGPSAGTGTDNDGDRTDAQGRPIPPGSPTPDGPSAAGSLTPSGSPSTTGSPGMSACVISPPPTPTPSASPSKKGEEADAKPPAAKPCPGGGPPATSAPPTPAPPTTIKPTDPPPTDKPTQPTSTEPSTTSEQAPAATTP